MYLKELTLRGFKSFASATTLRFEPGITAIVGPNGSGKSNIVDALTWVMGEQGARNLRGDSMEDVIFAGTSSRPPLGRAQVSLTIDNSDHALDIDYSEVTISRTIFRNGGSEYAINGTPCRLLDVQELLSDSGMGRQMHVIVGQGRLDSILRADPAGHRALIEEAAGIVKHRRRKERALRKLSNTETNLSRLDDLLGEIHRQMGPLGRQAKVSRRADAIQTALRDAQARLYAEDAVNAAARRDGNRADLTRVRADLTAKRRELAHAKVRIEQLEGLAASSTPDLDRANRTWQALTRLEERFRALSTLAGERARSVRGQIVEAHGEDPDVLTRRADEIDAQAADQARAVDRARLALDQATETRADIERRLASVRQTLTELRTSARRRDARIADLRERVAREEAAIQVADNRAIDLTAQRDQLDAQRADAVDRADDLARTQTGQDDDGAALAQARDRLAACRDRLDAALASQRDIQSRIISLTAKADALADTLGARNASGMLESDERTGSLGRLADFLRVADGWEEAVARALGDFAGALVVTEPSGMLHALERARDEGLGRAVLLTASERPGGDGADGDRDGDRDGGEAGAPAFSPAADLVSANPSAPDPDRARAVVAAVRTLLADVAVASDAAEAQRLVDASGTVPPSDGAVPPSHAPRCAITRDGELFVAGVAASGGSSAAPSDLSLAARRDRALEQAEALRDDERRARQEVDAATQERDEAARAVDEAARRRTEAQLVARQNAKARADAAARVADLERQIAGLDSRIAAVADETRTHRLRLDDLTGALDAAQRSDAESADSEELAAREHELESALGGNREAEVTARLAWTEATRTAESLGRQSGFLRDNARQAAARRARLEELNARRRRQAERLDAVARDAADVGELVAASVREVMERRDRLKAAASSHDDELRRLRAERDGIEPQATALADREHALDVERERLAAAYGQLTQKVEDDLGMGMEELVRDYGPDVPVPVLDENGAPVPLDGDPDDAAADGAADRDGTAADASGMRWRTEPYDRDRQRRRLDRARRDLAALGKVNPLAVEEYDALKERNAYLRSQRDDVARSRADLLHLVGDLDRTMAGVFRAAFDDTAAAFEKVFATLFPGGRGRLRLEDPDDPLSSGVIVEASPAGKRVRQLSLLSGGERSLTALALLFAIFTARPSPFYVMDEVEAALDDINLTRLLDALEELRTHAQLLVITHQQRTMSIADALYGVTMRSDGVTAVVSQRLRRPAE